MLTASLQEFFTDPDDHITGSTESDPMGLLPVWTGLAGNLFKNRVNSRINDLRAYTINLFHCWIARRIRQDMSDANWDHEERSHCGGGQAPAFTRALLVLQEKMLLASLCHCGDSFDDDGILGLATARRKGADKISLNLHHRKGEVLVRQAQLGFSGAYRSAFTNGIKLLDPTTGHPLQDAPLWKDIDALFRGMEDFKNLGNSIATLIEELLRNSRSNHLTLGQLREREIPKGYQVCFGRRERVRKGFAGFWNKVLALDTGETASLWMAASGQKWLKPRELFLEASRISSQSGVTGCDGVGVVLDVAPFLARIEQTFVVLRSPSVQSLEDAAHRLDELFGQKPLQSVAPHDLRRILDALPDSGVGRRRMAMLAGYAELDAIDLVRRLLEYHKDQICKVRGAQPWIEIQDEIWRCHVVSDRVIEAPDGGDFPWEHDFYAGAFQSLAKEIQGGVE